MAWPDTFVMDQDGLLEKFFGEERRLKLRLYGSFPATVRGVNDVGEAFEIDASVENIGAGGLYLRMAQKVSPGARLFIVTRLTVSGAVSTPRLALRGTVQRAEPQPDGTCGVAVGVTSHRFL